MITTEDRLVNIVRHLTNKDFEAAENEIRGAPDDPEHAIDDSDDDRFMESLSNLRLLCMIGVAIRKFRGEAP